jgi:AcrR family transcriptional regulator
MAEKTYEPQQQRSREKVARILAAAGRLLDTTPYAALGTKQIAAEAGVSIGVLYRYFADIEAIVASLVRDWLRHDVETIERITAAPLPQRSRDLFERLITAYADGFRRDPGRRNVWYHAPSIPSLKADNHEADRIITDAVHSALVRGYSMPDTAESRRRVELAVEVVSHLLDLAFRDNPEGDAQILADAALIADRYLFAP